MAIVADLSGNFPTSLPPGRDTSYSHYLGEIANPAKRSIVFIGQSNAVGMVRDAGGPLKSAMDAYYPDSINIGVSCATGGAALIAANGDGTNHYYDPITGADGAAWITAENVLRAHLAEGYYPIAIYIDQGESDQDNFSSALKVAEYRAAFELIFVNRVRNIIGRQVPAFICPIGRYDGALSWSTWQVFREMQRDIAAQGNKIYLLPEKFATPMDGAYHNTSAGYQTNAYRMIDSLIAMLTGMYPKGTDPKVRGAARAGTSVVVSIEHVLGNDILPTTAIQGFQYEDNGVPITISAAVRGLTGSHINLTLASAPVGVERLYYGRNEMLGVDYTKLVMDNATRRPQPLKTATITPRIAGATSIEMYVPSTVVDWDARIGASYNGTGQTITNLVANPADGSTSAENNFQLGNTSAATTTDPTFVGTPNTPGAYFLLDGGDVFTLAGTLTPFLGDMHKTTGSDFWVAIHFRYVASTTAAIFATGSSSVLPHMRIQAMNANNLVRVQFRDDAGVVTFEQSVHPLVDGADHVLVVTYSRVRREVKIYINSALPDTVAPLSQEHTVSALVGTIAVAGGSGAGATMAANTRIYGCAIGNAYLSDHDVASILAVYADRAV